MHDDDNRPWLKLHNVAPWRVRLAQIVDGRRAQAIVTSAIVLNAVVLGLQTYGAVNSAAGVWLEAADLACLALFVVEIGLRLVAYGGRFWRNGWNLFDTLVVAVALAPGTGGLAVLRSLRVLRVLRLLTVLPQLRRVVAAFFRAVPGLAGVLAVLPAAVSRGRFPAVGTLAGVLGAVAAAALAVIVFSTASALRGRLTAALRDE